MHENRKNSHLFELKATTWIGVDLEGYYKRQCILRLYGYHVFSLFHEYEIDDLLKGI